MRSTPRARLAAWQHSVEREVAPHVEEQWAAALLLELRLRGVPGDRIGAVLAEVDSHCAESGQNAAEAFGDATSYARELDLPVDDRDVRGTAATTVFSALQVLGMLAVLWGFDAWRDRQPLALTIGQLVTAVVLLAVLGATAWRIDAVLRAAVRHPVRTWLLSMAYVGVLVVVLLALDRTALHAPAGWVMSAGAVLLLVGGIGQGVTLREDADDPVRTPLGDPSAAAGRTGRAVRVLTRLTPLMIPAFTALAVLLAWLVGR